MANFIEFPHHFHTPFFLNVEEVHKVLLYDGPSKGGGEIKVVIWERNPGLPISYHVKFSTLEEAKAFYDEVANLLRDRYSVQIRG